MTHDVRFARTGEEHIAFQVIGDAERDLLVVMDGFIPIDTMESEPRLARAMARLASFSRLIRFDRRGIGLSDPISPSEPPTIEQWVHNALAVLDAAESSSAVVLAAVEASPIALMLAATHPERVDALVLVNGYPRAVVSDDYPEGLPRDVIDAMVTGTTDPAPGESSTDWIAEYAPSAARDPQFREWWTETGRRGASPATARALLRVGVECDVRPALGSISMPTLLVHFRDHSTTAAGHYMRDRIAQARFVDVPGRDDYWWAADTAGTVLDEIEEFLTGARRRSNTERALATVLFTDIVGSTARASTLGDRAWRDALDRHDATVRRQLARFGGREINTTGDGFVATFDGPARAVECAGAIRDASRQIGIETRAGIHTGEVEVRGDDIGGIAVHIAARVAALADPMSVWVSRTVTDLVVGSELRFSDRGEHDLKGVPGRWRLFSVDY
jgi:class 3 adenylate cyclase